jgi:hypothetical protein
MTECRPLLNGRTDGELARVVVSRIFGTSVTRLLFGGLGPKLEFSSAVAGAYIGCGGLLESIGLDRGGVGAVVTPGTGMERDALGGGSIALTTGALDVQTIGGGAFWLTVLSICFTREAPTAAAHSNTSFSALAFDKVISPMNRILIVTVSDLLSAKSLFASRENSASISGAVSSATSRFFMRNVMLVVVERL